MNRISTLRKVKEIAKKHNLTAEQVLHMGRSQFEFTAQVMKAGIHETREYKTVCLPMFGKFLPSKGKIQRIVNAETKRRRDGVINA